MDVRALLNPRDEEASALSHPGAIHSEAPPPAHSSEEDVPYFSPDASTSASPAFPRADISVTSAPRKGKAAKDGFAPTKGTPNGPLNYLPYEAHEDPFIAPSLEEFKVSPSAEMGRFRDFPRHIPYSSSKKDTLAKIGRKGFDGSFGHVPARPLPLLTHPCQPFSTSSPFATAKKASPGSIS
jgi:hypothetical protein